MTSVAHETPIWTVSTAVFDGPLDLLLHLVRRDGIDLKTLPVAEIADSYLEYLDRLRELHLDIASDYLVMAATLCHLKSLELLPRPPTPLETEDESDPREVLRRQLLDYQRFREAAERMDCRVQVGRDTFVREPVVLGDEQKPITVSVDAFGLLDAYYELLQRKSTRDQTYVLGDSGPDLTTCCRRLLQALGAVGGQRQLGEVLLGIERKVERILMFIASLELARLGLLEIRQEDHLGPVWLTSLAGPDADLGALGEWPGEAP
jgi:segregation and condensation protein A